jgi:hypothetical protein
VATEQSLSQVEQMRGGLISTIDSAERNFQSSISSAKNQTLSGLRTVAEQKKGDIDKQANAGKMAIESGLIDSANALQQAYINVSQELQGMD